MQVLREQGSPGRPVILGCNPEQEDNSATAKVLSRKSEWFSGDSGGFPEKLAVRFIGKECVALGIYRPGIRVIRVNTLEKNLLHSSPGINKCQPLGRIRPPCTNATVLIYATCGFVAINVINWCHILFK